MADQKLMESMNNTVAIDNKPSGSFLLSLLTRVRSVVGSINVRRNPRRLKVSESVSLGEKRFIAVVEFEDRRFLVGVTPQNIALLQSLGSEMDGSEKN